ncbi:MAG TPA: LysR family transcriptional regulator [Syntrophales bacterium]|jgi:molybdate transport system regulatory protein|nr:LysR family transcriptional regulator [Syntrophales bacterium]HPC33317.1 LysR family transcriptional regulator [Syntrophales bacterium]HQG34868.1 LysR family transcriptional regulator [Syntrophales bacterium]HQI35829.1 LysR family transcriptional regulator [Syntrophales bacterium]HRR47929.1 LysR family transcriptional regulator [Syntrophales bacterium]
MEIKYKIWLEKDGKVIFGHGRVELLQAVEECHSLNAAAKKLNMSYRAAWGRLRASEERLGIKLIESEGAKKGVTLTPAAMMLLEKFRRLEKEADAYLKKSGRELAALLEGDPHGETPEQRK